MHFRREDLLLPLAVFLCYFAVIWQLQSATVEDFCGLTA
jgi:hypothetical protein